MGSRDTAGLIAALALSLAGQADAGCAPDSLDVRGPSGMARFSVEVADDGAERARGLMFREDMPTAAGMLFVYDRPQSVSFWMKNTLIPLDMIFADESGRVTRVHSDAVPGDLTPIDGGDGVQFVLEINGGLARRMGIAEGAEIRHPAIDPSLAVWPCE